MACRTWTRLIPACSIAELLPIVRRHQAAIVGAHPFRWEQDFKEIIEDHGPVFDALELVSNNVTPETRRQTEDLLARYPKIGATGSSDAHRPEVVGCYHTCFPRPIRSMADFVQALRQRSGQPGYLEGSRLASGPVELSVSPVRAVHLVVARPLRPEPAPSRAVTLVTRA